MMKFSIKVIRLGMLIEPLKSFLMNMILSMKSNQNFSTNIILKDLNQVMKF